jgi:hypothetical protein
VVSHYALAVSHLCRTSCAGSCGAAHTPHGRFCAPEHGGGSTPRHLPCPAHCGGGGCHSHGWHMWRSQQEEKEHTRAPHHKRGVAGGWTVFTHVVLTVLTVLTRRTVCVTWVQERHVGRHRPRRRQGPVKVLRPHTTAHTTARFRLSLRHPTSLDTASKAHAE